MKKLLKIIGSLVALILILLISLPYFFKDDIIKIVKQTANENLNASLEFEDLSLSFISNFPKGTVVIEGLTISGIDSFEDVKLMDLESLEITLDLMSLFGDTFRLKSMCIIKPKIDVRVLEDGSANYDIVKDNGVETDAKPEDAPAAVAINFESYSIVDGSVKYEDKTMPFSLDIQGLNHQGNGNMAADELVLSTKTKANSIDVSYDGIQYLKNVKSDIEANLKMNLSSMHFEFAENVIRLNNLELGATGTVDMPEDKIDINIDFTAKETGFEHLLSMVPAAFASDLEGVDVEGKMNFDGKVKGVYNDDSLPGFELHIGVTDGRFNYTDLPKSVENIQMKLDIDASDGNDYDKLKLDLESFHLEIGKNPVDMSMHLRTPLSDPDIKFQTKTKIILDDLADVIPLEENDNLTGSINADFKCEGKLSSIENEDYEAFEAQGQLILQQILFQSDSLPYSSRVDMAYFNFSPENLNLSLFKAKIGESDISAQGKINNYLAYALRDEPLEGKFEIQSKYLNLDELYQVDTVTVEEVDSIDSTSFSIIEIPGNIDFELDTKINTLHFDGMEMVDLDGKIIIKNQEIELQQLHMKMLDGSVLASGRYATPEGKNPHLDFDLNLDEISIGQAAETFNTIQKLAPIAKSCQGKFTTEFNISSDLNPQMEPIETTMRGSGRLRTKSVLIEKFIPLNKLAETLKIDRLAKQTIKNVNLSFRISNGKVEVDPFEIKLDGIPATVEGTTTLLNQNIDYSVKMDLPPNKLPGNINGKSGKVLEKLNNDWGTHFSIGDKIPINLHISGTVENPKIMSNYGEFGADAVQSVKDEVIESVKEKVQEQIEEVKSDVLARTKEEAAKILEDAQATADRLLEDATTAADAVKNAAYEEAQKVEASAKNILEKKAKEIAAKKIREEADKAHTKAVEEAQKKATKIMEIARKEADDKINSFEE